MNPNFHTLDDENTIQDFELHSLAAGRTLCGEKYRLEKEAGAGGMGVVWKAWDQVGERWVALKFVPPEIRHSEGAMAQVKTAFQTIQALSHTNICRIHGLEKDAVFGYFVVMEWLDGQPLNAVKLSQEQIPVVLAKVADALDYAHAEKVVHRDVKPSNIFLGANGKVWLIDFGIAAEIQNSISMNTSSTVCRTSGTRPYMAPEQWRGQMQQDGRADQYALGVVAYQLYTGHLPFENPDIGLLCNAVLNFPPEEIDDVPPAVNAAIQRALSKDRKVRFATCREFIDALVSLRRDDVPVVLRTSSSAKTAIDQIVEAERRAAEAKRLAEEEAKRKRIQKLDELAAEEYQSARYAEAIPHLTELLKLRPNHPNTQWLLENSQKKLEIQKKEEAKRKAQEEAKKRWSPSNRRAGDRVVVTVDGIEYAFRWCPPGEFMMGDPPEYATREVKIDRTFGEWLSGKPGTRTEQYVANQDQIQHRVVLTRGFWLMETEVTQAMWESVMGSNPSHFKGSKNPVESVSWDDCQEFCRKLGQKLGQQVQLPTEAQWEYACRAGTTGTYAGNLDEMGWYKENSDSKTHAVGLKKPNAWGLYDMHGNVCEWCLDWYASDYYTASPTSDPNGPNSGSNRVNRGGSWLSNARSCRSANRFRNDPEIRYISLGGRALLVPVQ